MISKPIPNEVNINLPPRLGEVLAGIAAVKGTFIVQDLGSLDYKEAWQVQLETHKAVAEDLQPPTLILVEHPPVITFGKKVKEHRHLLISEEKLKQQGFTLYDVERGGDVTYHGPGQLVGYPIFKVGRRVRDFLRGLEQTIIHTVAEYGIASEGSEGYAGVWVGDEKIAAIGVAIKRNVSFHGFALNVHTDLSHFNTIVPCGLVDKGVTSLSELLGRKVMLSEVKPKITNSFKKVFFK